MTDCWRDEDAGTGKGRGGGIWRGNSVMECWHLTELSARSLSSWTLSFLGRPF